MLEYLSLSLIAFAAAEVARRVKVRFGGREVRIRRPRLAWLLLLASIVIASFGLFAFSSGLVAHNLVRKQDMF